MDTMYRALGTKLAEILKEKGWSQTFLGKRIGVSQTNISAFTLGKRVSETAEHQIRKFIDSVLLSDGVSRMEVPVATPNNPKTDDEAKVEQFPITHTKTVKQDSYASIVEWLYLNPPPLTVTHNSEVQEWRKCLVSMLKQVLFEEGKGNNE